MAIFRMALHGGRSSTAWKAPQSKHSEGRHCPEGRHQALKLSCRAAWLTPGELQSAEGPALLEDVLCQEPHKPLSAGHLKYAGSL